MAQPELTDDGSSVTLDLHGATVDEALDLTYRTLREAKERGRLSLKVIHGSSTTGGGRRTIKQALHEQLDQGTLGAHAFDVMRSRDYLVFSLDITSGSDSSRIRLSDVQPLR